MEQHEVLVVDEPDATVLALRGEIDLAASEAIRLRTSEVVALPKERVILDLSGTTFLDSSGLNSILAFHNAATAADKRVLMRPGPELVMRVLSLVGLSDVFETAD